MTTTPTRIASTIPATEDSRTMCFRQGKACVYASEEDGRIIITEPPGGVVERLDTRTGQITGSGPMTANANGTGHQPPIPKLTIVIGGNGAGKTTWCREHPQELPEAFYNPDAIAQDLGDWNDAGNQLEAGRIVNAAIRRHLEQGEDFGFESTYSGRSRPRIVQTAASNGYEVWAVFIGTNGAEINIERVGQRVRSGTGHDVPIPEITRRWSAAQKNLAETAASLGTIDVLGNSHGVTRHVASITKGGIRFPATPTPAWAWALIRQIEQHRPTT